MAATFLSEEFLNHVETLWRHAIGYVERRGDSLSSEQQKGAKESLIAVVPRLLQDIAKYRTYLDNEYRRSDAIERELDDLKKKMAALVPDAESSEDPAS